MITFQRFSTGPTLPDLIRAEADVRAAASGRMLPLAVWCRHSTLLMVRGHDDSLSGSAMALPSGPLLLTPVRRAGRAVAIRAYFLAASFVLIAARLLLSAGLLRPDNAELPLRWSSGLACTGMRLWRRSRLCRRP